MSQTKIIKAIENNISFLISTHENPDPDALCSELALACFLKGKGKKVTIVNNERVPNRFHFFPDALSVKPYRNDLKVLYDAAIVVDCGELSRVGKVINLIQKDKLLINIDHHITNDSFGDINLVQNRASSTAEVLYDLMNENNFRMNKKLAILLYLGIMTDTGSFRYENTTEHTHSIAAALMKFDISADKLYRKIYETIPLNDLKLFTKVISGFRSLSNGKITCVQLLRSRVKDFSEKFDLRDAIFRFLRSIEGVEVVVIFTEVSKNETKVNFRSSGKVDVAKIAHHFGGGGHRQASGCLVRDNVKNTMNKALKQIRNVL